MSLRPQFRLESDYAKVIAATHAQHRLADVDCMVKVIEAAERPWPPLQLNALTTWYSGSGWRAEVANAPAQRFSVCSGEFATAVQVVGAYKAWAQHTGSFANCVGTLPQLETPAVGEFAASSQVDEIERAIAALGEMPNDWDGRGGVAPSVMVRTRAIKAVKEVRALQIVNSPEITVSGDGEIGLVWEAGEFIATLSFLHNGTVYGYANGPGMEKPWELTSTIYPFNRIVELATLLASNLEGTHAAGVDGQG